MADVPATAGSLASSHPEPLPRAAATLGDTVHQTMIIAKMAPTDADKVAEIFGRSDATSMPHEIGVRSRSLYQFH